MYNDNIVDNENGSKTVEDALLLWFNESFTLFKEEPLLEMSQLKDPQLVFKILQEM